MFTFLLNCTPHIDMWDSGDRYQARGDRYEVSWWAYYGGKLDSIFLPQGDELDENQIPSPEA